MSKRLKSGLITLVSLFGAIVVTPQWVDFTKFASDKLSDYGIPVAVIGLLTVVLSEIWKQIINWRILNNRGVTVGGTFNDYQNELY